MAAVTHAVATADTGVTPNTSGAFTPAEGDLLIVWACGGGTLESAATLTSSISGNTFTQFATEVYSTNERIFGFVADQLIAAGEDISQTVTFSIPADECTGSNIVVERVAGMTKTGLTAVRQFAVNNSSINAAPNITFPAVCLTGNPTLGAVRENTNPATVTEPTGWTESADIGYDTPTNGMETVYRDSGFTGDTITWGSTEQDWMAIGVELDASASDNNAPRARFYEMMRAA